MISCTVGSQSVSMEFEKPRKPRIPVREELSINVEREGNSDATRAIQKNSTADGPFGKRPKGEATNRGQNK